MAEAARLEKKAGKVARGYGRIVRARVHEGLTRPGLGFPGRETLEKRCPYCLMTRWKAPRAFKYQIQELGRITKRQGGSRKAEKVRDEVMEEVLRLEAPMLVDAMEDYKRKAPTRANIVRALAKWDPAAVKNGVEISMTEAKKFARKLGLTKMQLDEPREDDFWAVPCPNQAANPGPSYAEFRNKGEAWRAAQQDARRLFIMVKEKRADPNVLTSLWSVGGRDKEVEASDKSASCRALFMGDAGESAFGGVLAKRVLAAWGVDPECPVRVGLAYTPEEFDRACAAWRGVNSLTGDFSGFDRRHGRVMIQNAFKVLWYAYSKQARNQWATKAYIRAAQALFVNKFVIDPYGYVLSIPWGTATGSVFTTIVNSIISYMLVDLAWTKAGKGKVRKKIWVLGDNFITGGPRHCLTAEEVQEVASQWGHELKPSETHRGIGVWSDEVAGVEGAVFCSKGYSVNGYPTRPLLETAKRMVWVSRGGCGRLDRIQRLQNLGFDNYGSLDAQMLIRRVAKELGIWEAVRGEVHAADGSIVYEPIGLREDVANFIFKMAAREGYAFRPRGLGVAGGRDLRPDEAAVLMRRWARRARAVPTREQDEALYLLKDEGDDRAALLCEHAWWYDQLQNKREAREREIREAARRRIGDIAERGLPVRAEDIIDDYGPGTFANVALRVLRLDISEKTRIREERAAKRRRRSLHDGLGFNTFSRERTREEEPPRVRKRK